MLENVLSRMEVSQLVYQHPNVLAAGKPVTVVLSLSEPCTGTGSSLLPWTCRQRCSKTLRYHQGRSRCPRAACICGRFLWSSPRFN